MLVLSRRYRGFPAAVPEPGLFSVDVKSTKAWKEAEWNFTELLASSMIPLPRFHLSPEQHAERLKSIVRRCPQFYPAQVHLGVHLLADGGKRRATGRIEKGFTLLLQLEEGEVLEELFDRLFENLAELWRFDLCKSYAERMVERFPESELLIDNLSHAAMRTGDMAAALRHATTIVEMQPQNPFFRSNLGWMFLSEGRLHEAETALNEALRLDPDNEVTRGNLTVLKYLKEHGGTYFDFLVQPLDGQELERLEDADDWETLRGLVASYNDMRLEAWSQTVVLTQSEDKLASLPAMRTTLLQFFSFVDDLSQSYLLHEDVATVELHFESIMNKFIVKFGDVDRLMLESLYRALFAYYGFLTRKGLVPNSHLRSFHTTSLELKAELMNRQERYNKIRHDDAVDEETKEAVRDELFHGDHLWPHP